MKHIDSKEFMARRDRLMSALPASSIAIIPSASEVIRNSDVTYPFRQDSDFFYLTGFDEPDAVAVLLPGRTQGQYILFCRERDPQEETWNGYRAGTEGAIKDYAADESFSIDDIDKVLPGLIGDYQSVCYSLGRNEQFDQKMMSWINKLRANRRSGGKPPEAFVDITNCLHELRLFKSAAEITIMQAAADISARAHIRAMQTTKPGLYEYQVESEILHEFAQSGARQPAYSSIVGSGNNACILHYIDNNKKLIDGDLLLIDAGCDYQYYAADITRTFPVSGRFTEPQKAIYQLVLDAQVAALATIKPGSPWDAAHNATVRVITQGLIDLGLLSGEIETLIKSEAYLPFYMHRAGHWLGMDVHDVGDYKVNGEWRALAVGMVLTVEPGIYIAPDNLQVDKQWRGIGVRIEDDVVVTDKGYHVLTSSVPKEIDAIEKLMARA